MLERALLRRIDKFASPNRAFWRQASGVTNEEYARNLAENTRADSNYYLFNNERL
jgi:hypothetical protein